MSSSPNPNDQGDPVGEESPEEPSVEETSEAVVETVRCPNCGRRFAGDYCPDCGQEADPPTSATSVIGGFFREFVDVENGFWPTLVGLTLRPGKTLRQYLGGARAGMASPGRYLLASVIISIGTERLLAWTGMGEDPFGGSAAPGTGRSPATSNGATSGGATADGAGDLFAEALSTALDQWTQVVGAQIRTLAALLLAVLLAVLLRRLFAGRLKQGGEALALGAFLSGHAELLVTGAEFLYSPAVSFYIGQPAEGLFLPSLLIQVGYVGFAAHRCFGPGWGPGLKGAFAAGWALIEAVAIAFMCMVGHAAWLALAHPERFGVSGGAPEELETIFAVVGAVCALPLLLHAGVEAYYRLW
ncbi:MAG: DUF3667 domain-containing protein [Salinibacter sp.]|uniref:DUF3667 domain-containing protein n=1 Tax=Salinibacter sp. TaxID=2065818 RepID=UPI0035D51BE5